MSPRVYRNLDEIFAGEYEGMRCAAGRVSDVGRLTCTHRATALTSRHSLHCRYADIKHQHKDEAELRAMDKIGYRYPRGESYYDIIARLDPVMIELLAMDEPLLLVSHQATLRMVRGLLRTTYYRLTTRT